MEKVVISFFIFFAFIQTTLCQERVKKIYSTDKKMFRIEYFNNKQLTRYIEFYDNGKKRKEVSFGLDGQLMGKQIQYYESGVKKTEEFILSNESIPIRFLIDTAAENYFVDVRTFASTTYYPNGKMKTKGLFVNSRRTGYWRFFTEEGDLQKEEFYKCLYSGE